MGADAKVSGWAAWAEWSATFDQLISEEPEERARGVVRVETWRARGRLPVAVDMTASFVEIMLNDPECNPDAKSPRSEHELRLMYSMAVIRLVNGIVDVGQNKQMAQSIADIAKGQDWPRWIVDLRHQASHQTLASLPTLRLAAKESLWLLIERFWRPQRKQLENRGHMRARAPRDRRLLDKRLKDLLAIAGKFSSHREVGGELDGGSRKARGALDLRRAANELIGLGADETRVLLRVFHTVVAGEPLEDGRQLRVVHALCSHSSENFSLRFARQLLCGALGWRFVADPVADTMPSVRNLCDTADASDTNSLELFAGLIDMVNSQASAGEPDRLLRWLQFFLTHRSDDAGSVQLVHAMGALAPLIRRVVLRKVAEVAGSEGGLGHTLAKRATLVWQVLNGACLDVGANLLIELWSQALDNNADLPLVDNSVEVASPLLAKKAKSTTRETPCLDDIEELLRARKRKRLTQTSPTLEESWVPWTCVGTVLDPDTLKIRCCPERGPAISSIDAAAECWRLWAANTEGGQYSMPADVVHDGMAAATGRDREIATKQFGGSTSVIGEDVPPQELMHKPLEVVSEAEYRQRAEALFLELKPFDV